MYNNTSYIGSHTCKSLLVGTLRIASLSLLLFPFFFIARPSPLSRSILPPLGDFSSPVR